jgi:pimeloyl-ACP methyl ester carboxylesterase
MAYITVGKENSTDIDLNYEDHGTGKPVVLIHGWPLSGASWEKQALALLKSGHRVITYDRRGFGQSSKPTAGYDYDTLAADLKAILDTLDLSEAAIIGFSMGGGEVARYLGTYGNARVSRAGFIAAIPPFLLHTADNPEGVPGDVFEGIKAGLTADRPAFLAGFLQNFYNVDVLGGTRVSDELVRASWNVAVGASPTGTVTCVDSWLTDFREDLAKITIPTIVIHGDADRIVPLAVSGVRTHTAIPGSRLAVIEGGPHGLTWTHADEVNAELIEFLG